MSSIRAVKARWILNSRGQPTVEVELRSDSGIFRGLVPSGASTGSREALELVDGGKEFVGRGVQTAISNVNDILGPAVMGMDASDLASIDAKLIELDGTDNKSNLGANAILGVSLACARAGASALGIPLYEHLFKGERRLPVPFLNIINGGAHAGNDLDIQEYMLAPTGFDTFSEALQAGSEVYWTLKRIIKEKHGQDAINVGDEGGFAPPVSAPEEPIELILKAVEELGYDGRFAIGLDSAASEFRKGEGYLLAGRELSGGDLCDLYCELVDKYPLITLEDPFGEDDWESFREITSRLGSRVKIIGDDIFVSNPAIVKEGIETDTANAVLLKVNQIGTVTESLDTVRMAYDADYGIMVSHRSGETTDDFIADLAVSIGSGMIKSGAPARGERTAKYNRLLRIEEESRHPYGLK